MIMILLGTAGQETCSSGGSNWHHTGTINTR
jgi:hypothetical protein